MHRSAGAASRRWWDATRRAEARATASSADIVGPRRARDPTVGEEEPSETFRLFVGYFGWRSARRNIGASRRERYQQPGCHNRGHPHRRPCGARPLPSLRTSRAASPRSSLSRVNAKEGTAPIPTSPFHRRSRRWRGSRDASTFSEGTKKTRRRQITRTTDATSTTTSRTLGPSRGASPRDARS